MPPSILPSWLRRIPIFARIAIGNSLIISLGAIGGTIITHYLADTHEGIEWIVVMALAGILLSLALNYAIIRTGLQPLHRLRRVVDRIQAGEARTEELLRQDEDADIHQLAIALNSLVRQLEASNQQFRALSERAINAQEAERKRIARSLHDDTGQALTTLIINLERLERRLSADEAEVAQADSSDHSGVARDRSVLARDHSMDAREIGLKLKSAHQLATSTLGSLRKIIAGLRPAILDDLGLVPAIRWYARSNLEDAGILVELHAPAEPLALPPRLTTTLFRIAQEAINNIVHHSQAQTARIELEILDPQQPTSTIYLRIEDDGCGFDVAQNQADAMRQQRWGLAGIQERVELVGGEISVTSQPGHGTLIQVYLPFSRSAEQAFAGEADDG
jgi:two-component system sensor histidine kinase UhpB